MPTLGFSHYNLRSSRELMEKLRLFYCEVVGLAVGYRPPFASAGYWLYVGERDVLHLTESTPGETRSTEAVTTFDHAAFNCSDRMAFERRLAEHGIQFKVARVPQTGQIQLFFRDPANNGVELNFAS
ncbi:MAG: VOC family protein [Propionivibrio sp.]|nr:VOC family protein [Propionivibrio sp.]